MRYDTAAVNFKNALNCI